MGQANVRHPLAPGQIERPQESETPKVRQPLIGHMLTLAQNEFLKGSQTAQGNAPADHVIDM